MLLSLSRQLLKRHLNPIYEATQRTVIRKAKTDAIGERKGVPQHGGTNRNVEQEQGSWKGLC